VKIPHSLASLLFCGLIAAATVHATEKKSAAPIQELASGSALLVDLKTNEILYSSNPDVVVPIASVTKLMTAMVALDAKQPLDERVPIAIKDVKEMRGVFSRVKVGSQLSRRDMLQLALMSSENRAAASLAENYPGGVPAFVAAMNAKATALGMSHTRYVEPTGLSELNVSSANDLVKLLKASRNYPLIGQFSTTPEKTQSFSKPNYTLGFRNTNHLVHKADWDIQLTKTGFTNEAGHCLVMRTTMAGKPVAFVVLDAFGKYTHMADANRLRKWMETGKVTPIPAVARSYKQQKNLAARSAPPAAPEVQASR
jgi:D-alanyl-D-alanine endopeptidase (penicillin-binding protein 7)